jgi:glycosyltransferase involved in cell wall biosynthesis
VNTSAERLRVVYLHVIGEFGGSSRSLYEAVRAMPADAVDALFVTQRGSVELFFGHLGQIVTAWGITKFDHTRYSHYRGVRWLVLLREISYLPATMLALWRARRVVGRVDVLHLNEFTGLPALWLARRWLRPRATVIHLRSLACENPKLARTDWLHARLRSADALVAIDESVRATVPADLRVDVIHNAFTPASADTPDEAIERRLDTLRPESFKLGFVGNLLLVKGILDLIEAARITRDRGIDVDFVVVGDDARGSRGPIAWLLRKLELQQDLRVEVERRIDEYQLRDRVHMVGFTPAIARVYRRFDALCFPSHFDAPGRPIFEAAFFGVPSIVAVNNPRPDTLVHEVTGLAVQARAPEKLADAIARLASDRDAARRMGMAAREMAERNFNAQRNSSDLLAVYRRIVGHAASK